MSQLELFDKPQESKHDWSELEKALEHDVLKKLTGVDNRNILTPPEFPKDRIDPSYNPRMAKFMEGISNEFRKKMD